MLGKLMKYEWKSTYKVSCMMIAVLAATTILGVLAIRPIAGGALERYMRESAGLLSVVSIAFMVLSMLLYVIAMVAVSIGSNVYFGIHFYKSMYSGEGYLTHTLPVGKHQLLCSKILVGGLWMILIIIAMLASVLSLVVFSIPDINFADLLETIGHLFTEVDRILKQELGLSLTFYGVVVLVSYLVMPFLSMAILFGAISLGQLFHKARILMAFVFYFGIVIVESIGKSLFSSVVNMRTFSSAMDTVAEASHAIQTTFNMQMISTFVVDIVVAVLLYLASWYVISRKLNLE